MAQALMIAGTGATALGQLQEGEAAFAAGKATARQYAKAAKASQAKGSRTAEEIRRQGRTLESDVSAAMAASGGVTDDPGAIQQLADVHQAVDYNALSALYEGETKAQGQRFAGRMAKWEGKQKQRASRFKALSTALSGGSQAFAMGG